MSRQQIVEAISFHRLPENGRFQIWGIHLIQSGKSYLCTFDFENNTVVIDKPPSQNIIKMTVSGDEAKRLGLTTPKSEEAVL